MLRVREVIGFLLFRFIFGSFHPFGSSWTFQSPRWLHRTSEVRLFDDRFCESIEVINLELVLSEMETLMGNAFSRWWTVYITTKHGLKNEESDRNTLIVEPWLDDLRDCAFWMTG